MKLVRGYTYTLCLMKNGLWMVMSDNPKDQELPLSELMMTGNELLHNLSELKVTLC